MAQCISRPQQTFHLPGKAQAAGLIPLEISFCLVVSIPRVTQVSLSLVS
jgi:hypothetical protein